VDSLGLKIKPVSIPEFITAKMPTALEVGTSFLETLWFSYACRIVEKAIEVYNLDTDRANEMRAKYLKRGDFIIKAN
jgi:hypothetical protein